MVALLTAARTTKAELYRCNGIYRWQPGQRWQYESGMNTWIKSVQLPDFFDFDPDMMKVFFDIGRELGRIPSSWVAAPNVLFELRRER